MVRESKIYDDHWICELAIPLKVMRFRKNASFWRFNAYRNDTQHNEISIWANMPREFILMDMNYMGKIMWEEPLNKTNQNLSILPYATGGITRDFEDVLQSESKLNYNFGGDLKIGLGSSMNLDLTINPDFSQVEVDRQVTNLDRFEIFFPERRQFFLENADLFGNFGGGRLNPFFSRRIGVSTDTLTGNNIQNVIYGGARFTGKLNDNLRLGVMSIQAASQKENDLPSYNYSIASVEQKVFDRSTIAAILVNKEAINNNDFGTTNDSYNRVAGLEYRLRSKDNYWTGKTSFFKAITPNDLEHEIASFNSIEYNRRKYRTELVAMVIGNGFDAQTGFIPRKDILLLSPEFDYRIFPKSNKIVQHTIGADIRLIYKLGIEDNSAFQSFGLEERAARLNWNIQFLDNTRFNTSINWTELTLLDDFDPTRIQEDSIFLNAGNSYKNSLFEIGYNSDRRKKFFYRVRYETGQFFGGFRNAAILNLTYRFVPYGSISIETSYNNINLPDPFETANLWLIGPKLDFSFTRNHSITTFIQYNNQLENVSINTRYQWRFAPASDFFLVYTDNYVTEGIDYGQSRNRGIIAKMTYWLNL